MIAMKYQLKVLPFGIDIDRFHFSWLHKNNNAKIEHFKFPFSCSAMMYQVYFVHVIIYTLYLVASLLDSITYLQDSTKLLQCIWLLSLYSPQPSVLDVA